MKLALGRRVVGAWGYAVRPAENDSVGAYNQESGISPEIGTVDMFRSQAMDRKKEGI